jgi:hypothetical protein
MPTKLTIDEPQVQVIVTDDDKVNVNICEEIVTIEVGDSGPQGPQGERGSQLLSGSVNPSPVVGVIGDQYINTSTGYLFGPKTESGWGSGTLIHIGLTLSDIAYVHNQIVASNIWSITHGLQFTPNIILIDTTGDVIEADCQYSIGGITVIFSEPIAGKAILS